VLTTTVRHARLNLSKLLVRVAQGEEVVIRNRSTPVARLVPYVPVTPVHFPDLSTFRQGLAATKGYRSSRSEDLVRADREERG
jgi:prevent-host-death family protein